MGSIGMRVCRGERPKRLEARGLTDGVWTLIERCWAQDPENRPKIDEVVQELTRIRAGEVASQTT